MIITRQATLSEVETLLSWADTEGWNPGLDDAAAFYASDTSGFYVSTLDDKPVAGISVVKQNQQCAFLGLYLCHPDHRGQGLGFSTWKNALEHLEGYTIGLDGVPEQQANYRKSGFSFHHRTIRYAGVAATGNRNQQHSDQLIREVGSSDVEALIKLDQQVGGIVRRRFIDIWSSHLPSRRTFILLNDDSVCGFITIRRCQSGHKLGPLIANDPAAAEYLIHHAIKATEAGSVILDVPEPNTAAMQLVDRLGMQAVFETARMYRGKAPLFDFNRLFGVATLELG